ncbi:SMI1/KNR4 family protein [Acidovorax sp. YS12]|nr:SMI1/KNR4 family protein [Acidovorax sp. YS12]
MFDVNHLKQLYEKLNGLRPVSGVYLRELEQELPISLPQDFLLAAEFFNGSGIAVMPLHAIAHSPKTNVLSETRRLRESIGLPENFLVLGEPPESLLVLDCSNGEVVWCDAIDAPKLGKGELINKPEVWKSYGDFLAYLANEEENDRI